MIIGCLIIPLIFLLRRSLKETEAFKQQTSRPTGAEVLRLAAAN